MVIRISHLKLVGYKITFVSLASDSQEILEILDNKFYRNLSEPCQVDGFLQFLSKRTTYKQTNLAPATIKQIYALVKSFYVNCYEKRIVSTHPDLIFTTNLLQRYKMGEQKLPKYINHNRILCETNNPKAKHKLSINKNIKRVFN